MVVPSLQSRPLVLALLLLAAGLARPGVSAPWEELPGLTDVRYEGAADLAEEVRRSGQATVDLPWSVTLDGHPSRRMIVGAGWLRFESTPTPTVTLAGRAAGGESRPDFGGSRTIDVLPAGLTELPPGSRILVSVAPDGVAVRWVSAAVP